MLATLANVAWGVAGLPDFVAFRSALNDPATAQDRLLRRYVRRNAATAFGREHGFDRVDSPEAFRRAVPVRTYDEIAPYVDRAASGEPNVLTAEPVLRLATSSGSTRARKLVPYTAELHREFNRAINPWVCDLFRRDPSLVSGCAYWSVSPVARQPEVATVVPIGIDDDAAYLGGVRRRLVDAVMAVPGGVRHCADVATFRYAALRLLLGRRDLRLISVWHPSFLDLLVDTAGERWDQLLADVAAGTAPIDVRCRPDPARADELRAAGADRPDRWWPRLRLVSAWADAAAAGPAAALAARFPKVTVQPKGLLATEAVVTVPFAGGWPVAVRSHWFEFVDDGGRARGCHALRDGAEYGVVVTTAGGLWRYALGDRVRVAGRVGRTPSLRFVGREDAVVDRFGEKLNDRFVAAALAAAFAPAAVPAFAMVAADEGAYTLFTQGDVPAGLAGRLDEALRANPHYAYCRDLGQLERPRVFVIDGDAYGQYVAGAVADGRRLGDVKATSLSGGAGWARRFVGRYVEG